MEFDVDNKDGMLAPGLYSLIQLQVRRTSPVITIPSQAVIFNQGGLQMAVVSDGKVDLRKIDLELDNGATVEVRAGLKPGDHVILSPPANIANDMRIEECRSSCRRPFPSVSRTAILQPSLCRNCPDRFSTPSRSGTSGSGAKVIS